MKRVTWHAKFREVALLFDNRLQAKVIHWIEGRCGENSEIALNTFQYLQSGPDIAFTGRQNRQAAQHPVFAVVNLPVVRIQAGALALVHCPNKIIGGHPGMASENLGQICLPGLSLVQKTHRST